ncbi:MAG: hypothetical protein AB1467_00045 [Candidatus Diapherotrites archaeon]
MTAKRKVPLRRLKRISEIEGRVKNFREKIKREKLDNRKIIGLIKHYNKILRPPERLNLSTLTEKQLLSLIWDANKKAAFLERMQNFVKPIKSRKTGKILPIKAELRRLARIYGDKAFQLEEYYRRNFKAKKRKN